MARSARRVSATGSRAVAGPEQRTRPWPGDEDLRSAGLTRRDDPVDGLVEGDVARVDDNVVVAHVVRVPFHEPLGHLRPDAVLPLLPPRSDVAADAGRAGGPGDTRLDRRLQADVQGPLHLGQDDRGVAAN